LVPQNTLKKHCWG